jgi:type IV secretion system protein VirB6
MGLVSNIGNTVDDILEDYAQTIFEFVAAPIQDLLAAMALIGLIFIALNAIFQFRPINVSVYLNWGFRYMLIFCFATMWANFGGIYDLLVELPDVYSALLIKAVALVPDTLRLDILDPSKIKDTETGMDEFGHAVLWISADFFRDTSFWDWGMSLRNIGMGVLILIIGGFFIAASAIIILVGKIGFGVAMSLAPLAIIMLMLDQTKQYFESWTRFTAGFVVLPLLTAALMAIVLYAAGHVLAESGASSLDKDKFFSFIFIMIAAIVLLFQLPTMAGTLAGAAVAAVGGAAVGAAYRQVTSKVHSATRMMNRANRAGQRVRDSAGVANQARKSGASLGRIGLSAISGFRQSQGLRNARRDDRLADRISGAAGEMKAPRRYYGESDGNSGTTASQNGAGSKNARNEHGSSDKKSASGGTAEGAGNNTDGGTRNSPPVKNHDAKTSGNSGSDNKGTSAKKSASGGSGGGAGNNTDGGARNGSTIGSPNTKTGGNAGGGNRESSTRKPASAGSVEGSHRTSSWEGNGNRPAKAEEPTS